MLRIQEQKGFTLVELAIVLTIVGLLIGGILKGQQLIKNSRVTATVAQINAFEASTTSFRDAYGELPGDLMDAQTRIPGCGTVCDLSAGTPANNKIGWADWDFITFQSETIGAPGNAALTDGACIGAAGTGGSGLCGATFAETILFWYELQAAGLITSITDEIFQGIDGDPTFGGGLPPAKIGGGFWVGNASGTFSGGLAGANQTGVGSPGRPVGATAPNEYGILGAVLVMVPKANPFGTADVSLVSVPATATGIQALSPTVAANIDRKIDDGRPSVGTVQSYGVSTSCYGVLIGDTVATEFFYNEGENSKDCGLIIRFQR